MNIGLILKRLKSYFIGLIVPLSIGLFLLVVTTQTSIAEKQGATGSSYCYANLFEIKIEQIQQKQGSKSRLQKAIQEDNMECFNFEQESLLKSYAQRLGGSPYMKKGTIDLTKSKSVDIPFVMASNEFVIIKYKDNFDADLSILDDKGSVKKSDIKDPSKIIFRSTQTSKHLLRLRVKDSKQIKNKLGKYRIKFAVRPKNYKEYGHLDKNKPFNYHSFYGEAGELVSIVMTSKQIDPYLRLSDGNKDIKSNDDINPKGNTTSKIELRLPRSGSYTVKASSYFPEEEGDYKITLSFSR
jgi:hypothetical protein